MRFPPIWLNLKCLHAVASDFKLLYVILSDPKKLDVIHATWRDLARDLKQFQVIWSDLTWFDSISRLFECVAKL